MKARLNGVATGLGCALLLSSSALAQDITLKYAHPTASTSSGGQVAIDFKKTLEELSDGAIQVQIFPDGQLGGLSELNELAASGAVQVTANTWGSLSTFDEQAGALDGPYVFADTAERFELLTHPDSQVIAQMNERLADSNSGLRVISPNDSTGRQATCNMAFHSPSDLDGVRFRAIPFPVFTATVEGMGAIPVPIEFNELTTALATGLVDCQENPLSTIVENKLYEAQSHVMLTNHILAGGPMLINADVYEEMSDEQRAWVVEAAETAAENGLKRAQEQEAGYRAELEELGLEFVGPKDGLDIEAFRQGTTEAMRDEFGDRYDEIYELIDQERANLLE